ncbi:MAG: hypothetical protein AAGA81_00190 [Acidobacteriota bacterium]
MRSRVSTLAGVALAPFAVYAVMARVIAAATEDSALTANILPSGPGFGWAFVQALALVSVFAISHVTPGLPWALAVLRSSADTGFDVIAKAFCVTVVSSIVLATAWKVAVGPLDRAIYLLLLLAVALLGTLVAAVAWRDQEVGDLPDFGVDGVRPLLALVWIAVLVWAAYDHLVVEAYNGDGVEAFYLTKGLFVRLLPAVLAEPWNVAIAPPLNAVLSLPHLLLLGETEFAMRFSVIATFFVLPFVVVRFVRSVVAPSKLSWLDENHTFVFVLVLLTLTPMTLRFLQGMTNAESAPAEASFLYTAHFALFALTALSYLRRERLGLFVLFGSGAAFLRWYDFVYFLLAFATLDRVLRRESLRPIVALLGSVALAFAGILTVLWLHGDLEYNADVWYADIGGYVEDGQSAGDRPPNLLEWIERIHWLEVLVLSGGLLALWAAAARRFSKFDVTAIVVFCVQFAIVAFIAGELPTRRMHYLLPVLTLPLCAVLGHVITAPESWRRSAIGAWVALGLITTSVVAVTPPVLSTLRSESETLLIDVADVEYFTSDRVDGRWHDALKEKTTIPDGLWFHVLWLHYADWGSEIEPRHRFFVTDGDASPPGFALVHTVEGGTRYRVYERR